MKIKYNTPHQPAEVAELADAHDSKSCSFGSVGSIPTFGTIRNDSTLLGMQEGFSVSDYLEGCEARSFTSFRMTGRPGQASYQLALLSGARSGCHPSAQDDARR